MQTQDTFTSKKTWKNRKSISGIKTFCGKIVYKRKKHLFSTKDIERISKLLENRGEEEEGMYEKLLALFKRLTIGLLEPLLKKIKLDAFVDEIYDFIYILLRKLFELLGINDEIDAVDAKIREALNKGRTKIGN